MEHLRKFTLRFGFVYIVLFAVTLPFPLYFFPSPGELLHPWLQQFNEWSALHIWGIGIPFTARVESDSTGLYLHLVHLFFFSLVLASTWIYGIRKTVPEEKVRYWFQVSASYLLAFFLLKYGLDKVFKAQFYLPEPNTLYTPMGLLSKDILFWSTMGSSYAYSVFMGILEVLPAVLLFSSNTRLLGGIIAFGVLLNVLAINLSFDISVKVLSFYLQLSCAYLYGYGC